MTFPKGKSGNPRGRNTETEKQKKTAALLLSPYVERAVKRIAVSADSSDADDHQWAINLIMSYVFGKPAQAVSLDAGDGIKSIQISIQGYDK